jgi:D-alanyl-D-alanine carboxypeptidase
LIAAIFPDPKDDDAAGAGAPTIRGRREVWTPRGSRGMTLRVLLLLLALVSGCTRSAPQADAADAAASAATLTTATAGPTSTAAPTPTATATTTPAEASTSPDPYGVARSAPRALCSGVAGKHVADEDLRTTFVDGTDLLALVNRSPTGTLAADFAPPDLVDLQTGAPRSSAECQAVPCMRKEAAGALGELLAEMKQKGFPGKVESAYRSYGSQCGTFLRWAGKGGFCEATEQSALPGHSQHQLGTTVDLFTEEWAASEDPRGVFREGFGCSPGGRFLQERAHEFGFVMPYPIHPDDRHPKQKCVVRWDIPININPKTGYRFEHWHFRYVGKDAAARFTKALEASGVGAPGELTLEQWLRADKGLLGADAEVPVCDGCNCGACATLAAPGKNACDKRGGAIHLDEHGRPLAGGEPPTIASAHRASIKKWHGSALEVRVDVPDGVLTQPPIVGPDAAGYAAGATFEKLAPFPETQPRAFPPLAHAWVVGVEPIPNETGVAWPWRAALAPSTVGQTYDRANVLLPAHPGPSTLRIPLPAGASRVRVVLLEGGAPRGEPESLDLR